MPVGPRGVRPPPANSNVPPVGELLPGAWIVSGNFFGDGNRGRVLIIGQREQSAMRGKKHGFEPGDRGLRSMVQQCQVCSAVQLTTGTCFIDNWVAPTRPGCRVSADGGRLYGFTEGLRI